LNEALRTVARCEQKQAPRLVFRAASQRPFTAEEIGFADLPRLLHRVWIGSGGEQARDASEPDILVEEPQSVVSGRNIEQVGEGDEVWDSSSGRLEDVQRNLQNPSSGKEARREEKSR
jgi:hypothetical protein